VLDGRRILIYKSHQVPSARIRIQHIEMTQDMAGYFNQTYKKEVSCRPEGKLSTTPKVSVLTGKDE